MTKSRQLNQHVAYALRHVEGRSAMTGFEVC